VALSAWCDRDFTWIHMETLKIRYLILAFLGVIGLGSLGFHWIEGWAWLDSIFMSVITVTTVGFEEVGGRLTAGGQVFTIFLILGGFGVAAFSLSQIAAMVLRGELNFFLGRIRMKRDITHLQKHYIIAGFGRTGKVIAKHFRIKGIPYVVVDNNQKELHSLSTAENFPYIVGDASDEEILEQAGIARAAGFVSVMSSDATNAFAIMTARVLNPRLNIISRALDSQSIRKLKVAGANKVIAPYDLGGMRIAQSITNPHASDFLEIVEDVEARHIEMADLAIGSDSKLLGKSVRDQIFAELNLIVIGIKKSGRDFSFNPKDDQRIEAGNHLILMGPNASIRQLEGTHRPA
jgi:voltage-gated potassium channel